MKNGICPKCKSIEIYTNKTKMTKSERNYIRTGLVAFVKCVSYICSSCGYIEEYIKEDEKHKIIKNFDKL